MKYFLSFVIAVFASLAFAAPAGAHPHVWVTVTSEVVYAPDGSATGVRQSWAFDEGYSIYATTGLPHKTAGAFTREELAELTKEVVSDLKDSDYYTYVKADGKELKFGEPKDYWQEFKKDLLTLHFMLPFKSPVKAKDLILSVYDPTYFIDFSLAEKNGAALAGAPAQCTLSLQQPKDVSVDASQQGPEAYAGWGASFATKVAVKCP